MVWWGDNKKELFHLAFNLMRLCEVSFHGSFGSFLP